MAGASPSGLSLLLAVQGGSEQKGKLLGLGLCFTVRRWKEICHRAVQVPTLNIGPMLCDSSLHALGSGVPVVFVLTAGLIGQVTNVSYVLLGPLLKK